MQMSFSLPHYFGLPRARPNVYHSVHLSSQLAIGLHCLSRSILACNIRGNAASLSYARKLSNQRDKIYAQGFN